MENKIVYVAVSVDNAEVIGVYSTEENAKDMVKKAYKSGFLGKLK